MEESSNRPFMTTGEIVRLANVHPNTVAMWRLTKKIVAKDKVGASFLYSREEVTNFLEQRKNKKGGGKVDESGSVTESPTS